MCHQLARIVFQIGVIFLFNANFHGEWTMKALFQAPKFYPLE
jgi:hypothetical protein